MIAIPGIAGASQTANERNASGSIRHLNSQHVWVRGKHAAEAFEALMPALGS